MSTHNICFQGGVRKILVEKSFLSGAMYNSGDSLVGQKKHRYWYNVTFCVHIYTLYDWEVHGFAVHVEILNAYSAKTVNWCSLQYLIHNLFYLFVCLCWDFTAESTQWGHVYLMRWVYLSHLYCTGQVLWVVNQFLCTFFSQKLITALLESAEGSGDHRKHFMINIYERMLPTRQGLDLQLPDHSFV